MIGYEPFRAIEIGPVRIFTWGIMVALAFFAILFFSLREAKKRKDINENHIIGLSFYALLGGLLGGRLAYVITNLSYYYSNPVEIVKIWDGGAVFYGGVLLALVFCWLYIRKHKIDFFVYGDLLAPYLALGIFVGRIGCFLNGCCFGEPTSLPWGMVFPLALDDLPRHPTQLYMSLYGLFMFVLLRFVKNRFTGFKILLFFMLEPFFRFFVDFVRYYPQQFYFGPFTESQWVSIAIFFLGLYIMRKRWKLKK